jgi:Amt family ammonium transporter
MNTNTAGLAGAIVIAIMMYVKYKKLDITMILNGALGGLVAITAGPDLYSIYTPILIGAVGGALVAIFVPIFDKLKLDDPVGALSVHLVDGIWGTIAVGLFSNKALMPQLIGIATVAVFAFASSFIVLWVINKIVPFRASDDVQLEGLDINECGMEAYPEFKRTI